MWRFAAGTDTETENAVNPTWCQTDRPCLCAIQLHCSQAMQRYTIHVCGPDNCLYSEYTRRSSRRRSPLRSPRRSPRVNTPLRNVLTRLTSSATSACMERQAAKASCIALCWVGRVGHWTNVTMGSSNSNVSRLWISHQISESTNKWGNNCDWQYKINQHIAKQVNTGLY